MNEKERGERTRERERENKKRERVNEKERGERLHERERERVSNSERDFAKGSVREWGAIGEYSIGGIEEGGREGESRRARENQKGITIESARKPKRKNRVS